MTSKSSAVHSIRIRNDLWAWLVEEAKRREVTPNGLAVDLLLVGQLRANERRAEAGERISDPKPAKRVPAETSRLSLPVGPAAYVPGSRLKKR